MIHRKRIKNAFLCVVLLIIVQPAQASILLTGDSAAPTGQTFSFAVGPHAQGTEDTFYVGAAGSGAKDFALSRVPAALTQFVALAPQNATVDNQIDQPNPIYNQGIAFLSVLSATQGMGPLDRLVVVTTNPAQAANVYLTDRFSPTGIANVLSAQNIKDANGLTTSGILALASTRGIPSGVFAAVLPNGSSTFGNSGSGIALLNFLQLKSTVDGKEVSQFVFEQWPAQAGSSQIVAAQFDTTSSFLKINTNLAAMTNVVDMYWDTGLQRLFVVIQGTANAGATDGVRAVAVGQVVRASATTFNLIFVPIAPASVFVSGAGNEIVGGQGSGAQVSWHKVRTMHTTTGMDYLIGVGGNGSPSATARSVFAMPIVNSINDENIITDPLNQATLADVQATPAAIFSGTPSVFRRRVITTPATTNAQIYTTSSLQALVGGGALAAGDIVDVFVFRDTVFAVVGTPVDPTQLPGIFYSQALFDNQGLIQLWTPWRRTTGSTAHMFGMGYNTAIGNINFMTGADANNVFTINRTQWGTGDPNGLQPLGIYLMDQFPQDNSGMQGFFDFPTNTPGLTQMSMFAVTGFKKVVLVESGSVVGGAFTPDGGDYVSNGQTFTDGTISPAANAKALSITGGELANLGAIVGAEIGVANGQGYLFVGGVGGVAVLANNDGTGWNAGAGLMPSFVGLTNGMHFIQVGNYSFVRRLIADGNFLYVLTDSRLDRIDMSASNFGTGSLSVVTLGTLQAPNIGERGTLLGCIVSGKFALLSTTNGLYRVGNGQDISTASDAVSVDWNQVPVNEGTGSVTQLLALSSTGRAQDVARAGGGNIYALNAYYGQSRGQVNRFTVADVSAAPITSTTIQAVPDILVEGTLSYFKNFGGFANQFATDGALDLYSRSRNLKTPPFIKSIQSVMPINDVPLPLNLASFSNIVRMEHSFASGSWLVMGDMARFNE